MSSLRVTILGSSSAAGTNLSDPPNDRYAALLQTYLRANRSSHCRVQVVAQSGIGLYEQQATGYSTPANRVGVAPVNTSFNITTALAQKPHVLILHQPAGNRNECITDWNIQTEAGLKNFHDTEELGLIDNIAALCRSATCEFYVMGCHPLVTSTLSAGQAAANWNTVQRYVNDSQKARYGSRYLDYFDLINLGGQADSNLMLVDGHHMNPTGLALVETNVLEAIGLATLHNWRTPLDIDT